LHEHENDRNYAIVGAAHVVDNIPLYYDGMNEQGLCVAALRFAELSFYHEISEGAYNLASYELIPWRLRNCKDLSEAKGSLKKVNVTNDSCSQKLSATPLHWLVGDKSGAIAVESTEEGLKVYDAEQGVLTNAPNFMTQCEILARSGAFDDVSSKSNPKPGEIPGDASSSSRFVRASFVKSRASIPERRKAAISRLFHVFDTVSVPKGLSISSDGREMQTVYTSCMDTGALIYYFTSYSCRRICAVRMTWQDATGDALKEFSMSEDESVRYLN
jgi:choloylglycine hydrolase